MIKLIIKRRVMKKIRILIDETKENFNRGEDKYECFDYVYDCLNFIWELKLISRNNIDTLWRELQAATED